ncbi:MAG: hypothetical protein ABI041_17275 [Bdellovibrionia bacterium]
MPFKIPNCPDGIHLAGVFLYEYFKYLRQSEMILLNRAVSKVLSLQFHVEIFM